MRNVCYALLIASSVASAADRGQIPADTPQHIRDWFKSVRSQHGIPCCDISDGYFTKWRGTPAGKYEVFFEGSWRLVPDEAVIRNAGNPTHQPIVWYVRQGADTYYIRCFVPGDDV